MSGKQHLHPTWSIAGASGLVIEEAIANYLELSAFGEMYVTGMSASMRCQFRRANELKLGPVTVQRPLFMQMDLSGVVAGAPGPVIGILGCALSAAVFAAVAVRGLVAPGPVSCS